MKKETQNKKRTKKTEERRERVKNNNNGITLIALVITIIVLLILAGISISMLSGDNSILNRATTARETTEQKQIEERVSLAYNAAVMEDINNGKGKLQDTTLSVELAKVFPGSKIEVDTKTDTTGKKWYVKIDNEKPVEVEAGNSGSKVAELPKAAGTTPYFPDKTKFSQVTGTDLTTGLVITDEVDTNGNSIGNEYVWIEVPSTAIDSKVTGGPDYSGVSGATDYTNIATALRNYCTTDKDGNALISSTLGWRDEYHEDCGFDNAEEYTTLYNKMLKSVYENGGFWIGRYEAGTDTARQKGDSANGITPLSKIDQYPINWITCSEAQIISGSVPNKGSYNSSLMFGIQWDLVLRHLSNKGVATNLLTENSETWGNYALSYNLNQTAAHGFQGVLDTGDWKTISWSAIESGYSSNASYDNGITIVLSTGATTRNTKPKSFILLFNVFEWTLEHATSDSYFPCAIRGGGFNTKGSYSPVSIRYDGDYTSGNEYICRI